MRILPLAIFSLITIGLVIVLDTRLFTPTPLGEFLSPQQGFWQNAEPTDADFSADLRFTQLKGKVDVFLDERLVPHVFAEEEQDLYFVQGYLHARFRLWQMELQTHAAAGRLTEIVGKIALNHDREFRRLGMVYGAEKALAAIDADPLTKTAVDNYTAGVNAYIKTLNRSTLPLEYKMLGYQPEPWNNMKTALFLKNMSQDLAGGEDDLEMTNARSYFSPEIFSKLYPLQQDSMDPIIPKGTVYPKPSIALQVPADADSAYFKNRDTVGAKRERPDRDNGSNNWVVGGSKTVSGAPILCNDPHLGLRLPAIWFEMQLSTPAFSAYGVSFPGSPGIIIGFNDSCAWGVTNGGRDVRDYYNIRFRDDSRKEYWFDSAWQPTTFRYEKFLVKDSITIVDTVAYTAFGPVMYDQRFTGDRGDGEQALAVRWKAHDPSNELKTFLLLDRAKDHSDYLAAVQHMKTPGQNFAFATKAGDIAMRTQGEWPAKWKGQGDFVMPGTDKRYDWQAMIPFEETPAQYNPERGFVSSANQYPADSSYPYYLGRGYPLYRGMIINRRLRDTVKFSPESMMALQTNNYNIFGAMALPLLLGNIRSTDLNAADMEYLNILKSWDLNNAPDSRGATIFSIVWENFSRVIFDDDFAAAPKVINRPFESSLLEGLLRDSAYPFVDNIATPAKETLQDAVTQAFRNSLAELTEADRSGKLEWARYKSTTVSHLLRLAPFGRSDLYIGGGTHCINATKSNHGPSWRMVVSLTRETQAYGIYPGGQNGNPGSRFYDDFIVKWVSGQYYPLWFMHRGDEKDNHIRWTMRFGRS